MRTRNKNYRWLKALRVLGLLAAEAAVLYGAIAYSGTCSRGTLNWDIAGILVVPDRVDAYVVLYIAGFLGLLAARFDLRWKTTVFRLCILALLFVLGAYLSFGLSTLRCFG
jgi:hypothetical protein